MTLIMDFAMLSCKVILALLPKRSPLINPTINPTTVVSRRVRFGTLTGLKEEKLDKFIEDTCAATGSCSLLPCAFTFLAKDGSQVDGRVACPQNDDPRRAEESGVRQSMSLRAYRPIPIHPTCILSGNGTGRRPPPLIFPLLVVRHGRGSWKRMSVIAAV